MTLLTLDHFAPLVGRTFTVAHAGAAVPLVLQVAEPLDLSPRSGGGFRLEFGGPLNPQLPQAIHGLSGQADPLEIFLVPVAQDQAQTRYEAVFN